MKSFFPILAALFLFTIESNGQAKAAVDSIDYNLFKSYNVDYKGLIFRGNNSYSYASANQVRSFSNSHILANYFAETNLEKKQGRVNVNSSLARKSVPKLNNEWDFNFGMEHENRIYYTSKSFYEINPTVSIYMPIFNTIKNNEKVSDYYVNVNTSLELRYGMGRINPTSEIFTVAFIIDELMKEGIDVSKLGQAELFEFGQVLVGIRNKRILDSRRARVSQFSEMANFINKYITTDEKEKTMANAIVLDNIFFAFYQARTTGHRWSFGIKPSGSFITPSTNSDLYTMNSTFDYQYTKALSRYINFNTRVNFGPEYRYSKAFTPTSKTVLNALLSADMAYYPNSRTEVSSGFSLSRFYNENYLNFMANANYFINYFTNLQLQLNYNVSTNNQFFFNAEIRHAFF